VQERTKTNDETVVRTSNLAASGSVALGGPAMSTVEKLVKYRLNRLCFTESPSK
jgi:hypothetical protein